MELEAGKQDPYRYCDVVSEQFSLIGNGIDKKLVNSERYCNHCDLIGAEYVLKSDRSKAFCNLDCLRASQGLAPIASEIFGSSNLLCGYELTSGRGGYCAVCATAEATQGVDVIGNQYTVGICDQAQCAQELSMQNFENVEQIKSWIRRIRLHKSYRQRQVIAAALSLWAAVRPATAAAQMGAPPVQSEYRQRMAEVYNDIVAHNPNFDFEIYDQFTTLMRGSVTGAQLSLQQSTAYSALPPRPANFAAAAQTMPPFDAHIVAKVLRKMFKLYNRANELDRKSGALKRENNKDFSLAASRPHNRIRAPENFIAQTPDELVLRDDVRKVYFKLARKMRLGDEETYHLLSNGLFSRPPPELRKGSAIVNSKRRAELGNVNIRAELNDQPPNAMLAESIGGPIDWVKRQGRKTRDAYQAATTGKPYSISSIERPIYQLFLLNQCAKDSISPALRLEEAIRTARKTTSDYAVKALRAAHPNADPEEMLRGFREAAKKEIQATFDRKVNKNLLRIKTEEELRRVCGRKNTGFAQLAEVPQSIGVQIAAMAVYFWSMHTEKLDWKTGQWNSTSQVNVFTDLRALFAQLAQNMGSENTLDLLSALLKN